MNLDKKVSTETSNTVLIDSSNVKNTDKITDSIGIQGFNIKDLKDAGFGNSKGFENINLGAFDSNKNLKIEKDYESARSKHSRQGSAQGNRYENMRDQRKNDRQAIAMNTMGKTDDQ